MDDHHLKKHLPMDDHHLGYSKTFLKTTLTLPILMTLVPIWCTLHRGDDVEIMNN
jgi:hypothetical protein